MDQSIHGGAHHFLGPVSFGGSLYPPAGSVNDDHVSSDANKRIQATKLIHQSRPTVELAAPGSNIAAVTKLHHIVRGATGTIVGFEVAITGAAGGDRTATVDLQKSTSGGAFATVLTAPITINSTTTIRTAVAATIASASLVDGDILQIVVALGGSSGTQPQGLVATTNLREDPA